MKKYLLNFLLFFIINNLFAQNYQPETYITGTDAGYKISAVRLGSLYNYTPAFPPFYYHWTGNPYTPTLVRGIVYNLYIERSTGDSVNYAAYIDFNDDGDFFDEGENVMRVSNILSGQFGISRQMIRIPDWVNSDTLRLRVICTYAQTIVPGGSYDYGETEDYDIAVTTDVGDPCNGGIVLTAPDGTFNDGSGPGLNYGSNLDCSWLIQPADVDKIILTLSLCDVNPSGDEFLITNGSDHNTNQIIIGSMFANSEGTYTAAELGSAFVELSSDNLNYINEDGFTLSYHTIPINSPLCHTQINPPQVFHDQMEHVVIDNTTLNNTSFSITGTTSAYSYFTADSTHQYQTATLYHNNTYQLRVTGTGHSTIAGWIDYNQNNNFEASEYFLVAVSSLNNIENLVSFTIPATALIGQTHMRLRSRAFGYPIGPNDACTIFTSGETEDYKIIISTAPQVPVASFFSFLNNVTVNQSVEFYDSSTNGPLTWQWFANGASILNQGSATSSIQFFNPGCYDITLIVGNAAGFDTITYTCMVMVTSYTDYCTDNLQTWNCDSLSGGGGYIDDISILNTPFHHLNSGCNNGGYSFWPVSSGHSASLQKGENYEIVFRNSWTMRNSVWIDFDHDGLFESSECSYDWHLTTANVPDTFLLNIPANALTGYTQMRIRSYNSGTGNDPNWGCSFFPYGGETQDYRINIVPQTTIPVANFNANLQNITTGQSINFTDLSTNTPTSWSWTFSGATPASSTSQNPTNIVYNTPGCYQVSLTATNSAGSNTSTQICYIYVTNPVITPVANFTSSLVNLTTGQSINFNDLSTNNPTSWSWTFNGASPSSSTSQNPTNITYNTPGCYLVSLTATNSAGSNTKTQTCFITVSNPIITPVANFTANTQYITVGQSVNFSDLSSNSPTSWSWTFTGATPASSNSQNPTNIVYNSPGCYPVSLTATNSAGSNTSTQTCYINVVPAGIQPQASFSISPACTNTQININNTSTNALSFNWEMIGAIPPTSVAQFPTITYQNAGTFPIKLIAINGANSDTLIQSITINPSPNVNAGNDVGVCFGSGVFLNASAIGNLSFNWTPAANLATPTFSQTLASPVNNTDYVITVNDGICSSSDTITVSVWPLPIAPIITQVGYTLEATIGFPAYQWYENNVIIPGETQSIITPTNNGNYTVDVIDTNGCISTSQPFSFVLEEINSISINEISVYPNPTKTILNIDLDNSKINSQIQILNLHGETILSQKCSFSRNQFNIEHLVNGLYILKIGGEIRKFVKIN